MKMTKELFSAKNFKSQPIFWSRLGFPYDPPTIKDGKLIIFSEDLDRFLRYHKQMLDQGVKNHTSILFSGWIGVDKYDYSYVDKVLDGVMNLSDDILYMPRIKLNPPLEWLKQNPEDVFCYYDAPKDKNEIADLVGTLKQDILGYESETGYYGAGGSLDNRPNLNGVIGMQSLSSKNWIRAAETALIKLVEHIEEKEYADRIIGYQVCFGPCGEDLHWGRASSRYGDYGINALRNFYDFGIRKYGNIQKLKTVWNQPDLSRDNVRLPSPFDRYGENENDSLTDLFRAEKKDVISIDYDEFLSENVCDALESFARTAKECSNGKMIGGFYGYFIECGNANYAGHIDIERLLKSPYIDFFAAPADYENRLDGESGGVMTATGSVNLYKQWVDETDLRTYIANDSNKKFFSYGKEGTRSSFWREACKNISQNSGFWWMDLGGGWYDDEFILNEVKSITEFMNRIGEKPYKSASDVLIVVDENSYYKLKENDGLRRAFLSDFICTLRKSGTLADIFRLKDLSNINLEQYKLVIFTNAYLLTKEELLGYKFNNEATLMFNYVAGIWDKKDFSLDNVEKLTGFAVEEGKINKHGFPDVNIKGEKSSVVKRIINGRRICFNVNPDITENQLRDIALFAGCKVYSESGLTLYGDNRFLFVMSAKGYKGEISFGTNVTVKDVFTGEEKFEKDNLSLGELGFKVYEII